ncbi:hypothetical protein C6500_12515 [Candidatus Poribacteria bacterium]|nr:MAG: hypothetical protein C6500_12515 [Candidatus Poribacteria bacterium]
MSTPVRISKYHKTHNPENPDSDNYDPTPPPTETNKNPRNLQNPYQSAIQTKYTITSPLARFSNLAFSKIKNKFASSN